MKTGLLGDFLGQQEVTRHSPHSGNAAPPLNPRHKKTGTQGFRFFSFQSKLANQQIKPGS